MNILSSWKEVARKVKIWWVISGDSIIFHCGSIKVMAPLTVHPPMSCVHNMSNSQLPQTVAVVGNRPEERASSHSILKQAWGEKNVKVKTYMSPMKRFGQTSSTWFPKRLPPYKTLCSSFKEAVTQETALPFSCILNKYKTKVHKSPTTNLGSFIL